MRPSPSAALQILKVTSPGSEDNPFVSNPAEDLLAVEEPLEIRIIYGPEKERKQKNISVTMCTPGNDQELATGFLFTEGIIRNKEDILQCTTPADQIIVAELRPGLLFDPLKLERHFYTTSSCGVCGKSSIEQVKNQIQNSGSADELHVEAAIINNLPVALRKQQKVFEHTGGLHASALFDPKGRLLLTREDVGRHNALDKVIGAALNSGLVPLGHHILLLSGRASFELIQKAAMAGIKMICAVGAPSSMAVEMAKDNGITLVGFLRDGRFNIYSGEQRIKK